MIINKKKTLYTKKKKKKKKGMSPISIYINIYKKLFIHIYKLSIFN